MKFSLFLIYLSIASCLAFACFGEDAADDTSDTDQLRALDKRASHIKRKAMDFRVMSLNALKNADAERGKAHDALVEAMKTGDRQKIDKARDSLDKAADDLKSVIKAVDEVIAHSMKTGMEAAAAEDMMQALSRSGEEKDLPGKDKISSKLESAEKSLSKAEDITERLRKDWLEPFFASSTTTPSTTSTTKAAPLPPAK